MLLESLSQIPGVGQITKERLVKLVGNDKLFNLLLHKPNKISHISFLPKIYNVKGNELVIIKVKIQKHIKPHNSRSPYKVLCYNPTGLVNLIFFKIFPYQINQMIIDQEIIVSGQIIIKNNEIQITHPEIIHKLYQINDLARIKLTYPLKFPLSNKVVNSNIIKALKIINNRTKNINLSNYEWLDSNIKRKFKWPNFITALNDIHFYNYHKIPGNYSATIAEYEKYIYNPAIERLSFDEILAWQLSFHMAKDLRKIQNKQKTVNILPNNNCEFLDNLEFEPTNAQKKAIYEINQELTSNHNMLRLLQGDVGSGKTLVAIATCLKAISLKKQCCILCPTTVLAKQHFVYFNNFLQDLSINIALLTSATTKKQKHQLIAKLGNHEIDILIATHAVLEDDIAFKNLGYVVIDEQHRFGVIQRLKLVKKGQNVDSLLMSATPIPRSLMMTLYGDMDISILDEKPKNRQIIETVIMSANKRDEIYEAVKRNIAQGHKIYWICPAIDEADKENSNCEDLFGLEENQDQSLENVTQKYQELSKIIDPSQLAIIHGQMKDKEKDAIMTEFSRKDSLARLLIATTVIEVGIDVRDATIIIIENAEHFGLAQLHQIRGRVGRSDKKSFCILLYGKKVGQKSIKRLSILKNTNDGFYIAQKDLEMRGSGDYIGTKQSGFPEFKIANPENNFNIMQIAADIAKDILRNDPKLQSEINKKYHYLIKLFGYDECLEEKSQII